MLALLLMLGPSKVLRPEHVYNTYELCFDVMNRNSIEIWSEMTDFALLLHLCCLSRSGTMLEGYSPVTQALLGTLFTWGLTAAGAALVFVFSSRQVIQRKKTDTKKPQGFKARANALRKYWWGLHPMCLASVAVGLLLLYFHIEGEPAACWHTLALGREKREWSLLKVNYIIQLCAIKSLKKDIFALCIYPDLILPTHHLKLPVLHLIVKPFVSPLLWCCFSSLVLSSYTHLNGQIWIFKKCVCVCLSYSIDEKYYFNLIN